jgi:hypothetical protein
MERLGNIENDIKITSEEFRQALKEIPGFSGQQIRSDLVSGDIEFAVEEVTAYIQLNHLPREQKEFADQILIKSDEYISPCAILEVLCEEEF